MCVHPLKFIDDVTKHVLLLTCTGRYHYFCGSGASFISGTCRCNSVIVSLKISLLYRCKYPHKSAVPPSFDLSNKPPDEVPNVKIELTSNGNGLTDCCE